MATSVAVGVVGALAAVLSAEPAARAHLERAGLDPYELVIIGGRVIDPASGYDAVANIGISGQIIAVVSTAPLSGRDTIDARGLIVAPGFIDILSFEPNAVGSPNKIRDGVATILSMHTGTSDPRRWYSRHGSQGQLLNFGTSFSHLEARDRMGIARRAKPTGRQIARLRESARRGLEEGALGVSFSPEYAPGTAAEEIVPLMHLARQYQAPVFFHARYSDMEQPGTNIEALNEILGYARESGAAVHVAHLSSTGGTFSMRQSLELLTEARAGGVDVTACAYPYAFWATNLSSARFDRGWQSRFRISFSDLQLAGTAERLTQATFAKHRRQGALAVAYAIPEEDVVDALQSPLVMIGSDAILEPGFRNHPRASGTFARSIGRYSRERPVLSLVDALAKMTIMPVRRLDQRSSAIRRKGRISAGLDADITILDYARVIDHATVEHPEYPSSGIAYVIVAGQIVMDPNGIRDQARPGRAIRGDGREPAASGSGSSTPSPYN